MNPSPILMLILLTTGLCGVQPAGADRAETLLKQGRQALQADNLEKAADAYEQAIAVTPEAGAAYYNLGHAYYRMEQYEAAAAAYEQAAALAENTVLQTRSLYNLGNAVYRSAEALQETDPAAAQAYGRQAAWLYRAALNADPEFADAAYNLELSWQLVNTVGDRMQDEQEKEDQQNQLLQYIREKLEEFIRRQSELIEGGLTGSLQQQLEKETRELAEVMAQSGLHEDIKVDADQQMEGPLKKSYEHTLAAADAMQALRQQPARSELIAALEALPADPDQQQDGEGEEESDSEDDYDMEYEPSDEEADMYEEADPFGDFSEYEEIRGMPPPNQSEMDILQEELRNQERRKQKKGGQYKAVEKDW